jgi:hypothetical protein
MLAAWGCWAEEMPEESLDTRLLRTKLSTFTAGKGSVEREYC